MSTIDLGIAERTPDVHTGADPKTPIRQPAPSQGAVRQDDFFYVGSVKIEPLEKPLRGGAGSVTA